MTEVIKLWNALSESLPKQPSEVPFWHDGERVLCKNEEQLNLLTDMFDYYAGEGIIVTGYYPPKEDERDGCVDSHTGYYYAKLD